MKMHMTQSKVLVAVTTLTLCTWVNAGPARTSFTYQGELKRGGEPVDEQCDFLFSLVGSDGVQIGSTIPRDNVRVKDGMFTVQLNIDESSEFGPDAFNGKQRLLEVDVCCKATCGDGDYTPLGPAQELTATPYASRAITGVGPPNALNVAANGRVGIGTDEPQQTLHVDGNEILSTGTLAGFKFRNRGSGRAGDHDWVWYSSGEVARLWREGPRDLMGIKPTGEVGIGTTNPRRKLHVKGNAGVLALEGSNHAYVELYPDGVNTAEPRANRKGWIGWGTAGTDSMTVRNEIAGATLNLQSDRVLLQMGDGGADTWFPYTNGEVYITSDLDGTANGDIHFRTYSDAGRYKDKMIIEGNTGEVGIGTTDPKSRLHVVGTTRVDGEIAAYNGGSKFFSARDTILGSILEMENATLAGGLGSLVLDSPGADKYAVQMATLGGASIRLKNTSGATSVTLDGRGKGTIRVGVIHITGADVAEKFPSSDVVEPGTVVEIDPNHSGQLRMARGAYNRRVAGVVSGANGLPAGTILGHLPGNEDAPAIALSGRVWVQCDASSGSISPGDLLTTAETPGHAMKVTDHARAQGAIVGKAMTSLSGGQGMVLVLVSLQ